MIDSDAYQGMPVLLNILLTKPTHYLKCQQRLTQVHVQLIDLSFTTNDLRIESLGIVGVRLPIVQAVRAC